MKTYQIKRTDFHWELYRRLPNYAPLFDWTPSTIWLGLLTIGFAPLCLWLMDKLMEREWYFVGRFVTYHGAVQHMRKISGKRYPLAEEPQRYFE